MSNDETRECPQCALVANTEWEEGKPPFPNCPNGHGLITEEGLVCKVMATSDGLKTYVEVGREGVIISSGLGTWGDVASLMQTILRLEAREPGDRDMVDFAQASARKWNRKRAKRRFYRWLQENDNNLPPLADTRLQDLADRLISDARERVDDSAGWTFEDISRWGKPDFLRKLKDYEIRKDTEPVLLVRREVPKTMRGVSTGARMLPVGS